MNKVSSEYFLSKQLTFPHTGGAILTIRACQFGTILIIRWAGVDSHGHWQAVGKGRCAQPYGSVYTNHLSSEVSLHHHYHDVVKVISVETALPWKRSSRLTPELYLSVLQQVSQCLQVKRMRVSLSRLSRQVDLSISLTHQLHHISQENAVLSPPLRLFDSFN